jgi:hypothetical protein
MEDALKAIQDTGMSGGLLWSLRFHNRDGGFYWHSEPSGGNLYKGFHWPGSPLCAAYDEINLMSLVRRHAFAIRGLTPPPLPAPPPPKLLPIADASAISWQGSLGAASYIVERAPKASGPWSVVADRLDESSVQYRPLFVDESAPAGNWYYRVRAGNDSGVSEPSAIHGPIKVTHTTFVDELADFSKVQARNGSWEIKTRESRRVKEDAHRAAGSSGNTLVYQLASAIEGFRVSMFFPDDISDPKFAVSTDGKEYHDVAAGKKVCFKGPGDYKYWVPVVYSADAVTSGSHFLKIQLTGETQVGRVEIIHSPDQ